MTVVHEPSTPNLERMLPTCTPSELGQVQQTIEGGCECRRIPPYRIAVLARRLSEKACQGMARTE